MSDTAHGPVRPAEVYLVVAPQDGRTRRAEGALAGLEAYLALTLPGEGEWPHVLDASRRRVTPAQLLGRARREVAEDPAAERRMVRAIAGYLTGERDAEWDRAWEQWTSMHDEEARLLDEPDQDSKKVDLERYEHERGRLTPILFGTSAWRQAGLAWMWRFGSVVPQAAIDYLDTPGLGVHFDSSELVEGVRDLLSAVDRRRAEREAESARPIEGSAPEEAMPLPDERQRGAGQ